MSETSVTDGALTVGICGAGAMGSGIAQVAAQSGAQVIVYDVSAGSRAKSAAGVEKSLEQSVSRGRITEGDARSILSSMRWTDDLQDFALCNLVIEAIVEDLAIKQALFAQIEDIVSVNAIIASNTSSLSIARLANPLRNAGRFVGMHFFNPATAMKLVEVVSGPATAPAVAQKIADIAKNWQKIPVTVADVPGFIVNRVARPYYAEAFQALQQSATTADVIDTLFRSAAGFKMGPLELTDLIGQDVNLAVARSVYESYFGQTRFTPQLAQSALVDAGWLGRKTGKGVYDYSANAVKLVSEPIAAVPLSGVPVKPSADEIGSFRFEQGDVIVRFTHGCTARAEAQAEAQPVALLDWFDVDSGTATGLTASDENAARIGASLLASWGVQAFRVADRPGMIVARTLAQIANAAGDAIFEGVSDEAGIDTALRYGANYPFGPFAWAESVGAHMLVELLKSVADTTGNPLYNPSEYWMQKS